MQILNDFEKSIGYTFKDESILKLSLTHPSYANEHNLKKCDTNQRLEFLGDAVLELVSSDFLYNNYIDIDEGTLTKYRVKIVCEESLSKVARKLNIEKFLLLGNGVNKSDATQNDSIMCDAIEAIIGAIYIDSGIDNAKDFIYKYIISEIDLNHVDSDYKSIIQEKANKERVNLRYELVKEMGPDHDKRFIVRVIYNDIMEEGIGKSKKEAEQNAARLARMKL